MHDVGHAAQAGADGVGLVAAVLAHAVLVLDDLAAVHAASLGPAGLDDAVALAVLHVRLAALIRQRNHAHQQHKMVHQAEEGDDNDPCDDAADQQGVDVERRHSLSIALGGLVHHAHEADDEDEGPDGPPVAEEAGGHAHQDRRGDQPIGPADVVGKVVAQTLS